MYASFKTAILIVALSAGLAGCGKSNPAVESIKSCVELAKGGFLPIAEDRADRFLGKVEVDTARCRGGDNAVAYCDTPWVDWSNYWATGDSSSRIERYDEGLLKKALGAGFRTVHIDPNTRGIDGALIDLECARVAALQSQ